jgi:hypothetical protein
MKFNKLMLFVFVIGLTLSTFAQKTWEKPIEKWNKEEALNILKESPWSQSFQAAEGSIAAEMQQTSRDQVGQRVTGRPEITRSDRQFGSQPIVVRLQSGLPIRQALVRLQQIDQGYDKMNTEQRARYDAEAKKFLDCKICQDYYVITITKFKRSSNEGVDDGMFQVSKFEDLKGNIQLVNDKGEQRELVYFLAPKMAGESATLYFKRKDDKGNLLLTPENKTVKLVFNKYFLEDRSNPYGPLLPRNFEFKVSKMMIDDQLAF